MDSARRTGWPLRLTNFRLLDGLGGAFDFASLETDAAGRIASLATSREKAPPSRGALDLEGRWLLPGLVDCHVHLTADASSDPVAARVDSSPAYLAIAGARNAAAALRRGVLTLRDVGAPGFADAAVKRAIREGVVRGPRLLTSGMMLTMTGGHGCRVGCEVDGADAARRAARINLKHGADNIKMVSSGGIMTPGVDPRSASLGVEELAAGFEEARKAGRLSACHAHSLDGVKNAVRAGVRTVEHGVWLDEEACALMRASGAYLCPTLSVVDALERHAGAAGLAPHVREKIGPVADALAQSFRMARALGVPMICGTDAGMPFTPHGGTATEVRLMAEAGVSPLEAIGIATAQSARALRVDADTGSVEPGKLADLLVVDGDPLEDLRALERPVLVFQAGRAVALADESFDPGLEEVEGVSHAEAREPAAAAHACVLSGPFS